MTNFLKPLVILSVLAVGTMAKNGMRVKNTFLPKTFEAGFVKEEKNVLSGKIMKSEGKINYQYPGRIRMESTGKDKTVFVSNPFETFLYVPSDFEGVPSELTVNKTKNVPISKFFDSLEKGLKSNKLYKVKARKKYVAFTFTKSGVMQMKILSAKLYFDAKKEFSHLKKVEITLDNNKNMLFSFNHIKVNRTFSKSTFVFKAPANTRVSH